MNRLGRSALLPVLAAALVAGCGTPAAFSEGFNAATGATPSAVAAPVAAAAEPLTARETEFLKRLAKIAPPLAKFPERAAGRAQNTCGDLTAKDAATGKPFSRQKIVSNAVARFSGGTYTVTTKQAGQIVDAAAATVCAP